MRATNDFEYILEGLNWIQLLDILYYTYTTNDYYDLDEMQIGKWWGVRLFRPVNALGSFQTNIGECPQLNGTMKWQVGIGKSPRRAARCIKHIEEVDKRWTTPRWASIGISFFFELLHDMWMVWSWCQCQQPSWQSRNGQSLACLDWYVNGCE